MTRFSIEAWPHGGWRITQTAVHDDKLSQSISLVLRDGDDEGRELRDLLLQHFPLGSERSCDVPDCTNPVLARQCIQHMARYDAHRERRERIATAVLAGMLANPGCDGVQSPLMTHERDLASMVVRYADFLIAALDEEKP
jgi:hypothetical protein